MPRAATESRLRAPRLLVAALVCLGLSVAFYGPQAWLWTLPLLALAILLGSVRRRRRARRAARRARGAGRTLGL